MKHLPATKVAAGRYFSAGRKRLERIRREFPLHPRQPLGLAARVSRQVEDDAICQ